MTPIPFFLIFLLTATVTVLPPGETVIENDAAELGPDETLDLSVNVIDKVGPVTETVGGQEIELTQNVKLVSTDGSALTIVNTALTSAVVAIPDQTTISAPAAWDKQITPPKTVSVTGTVPTNFLTPTTAILVGSPDVVLVFDKAVTILLTGTTGQTAYKLPGETEWILISGCTGTYANPDDPPVNGECSISNGIDTKIVTFHFTHFGPLEEDDPEEDDPEDDPEPKSTSTKSGGSGRTGVGPSSVSPGQVFVPVLPEEEETKVKLPDWFRAVVFWWAEGKITEEEMNIAMQYLFKIL